ncbi:MAG: T9SS type A sorting domain-containing protein, partial [Crocinitomicaceae bacterium]
TPILNGAGPDFAVFENGFADNYIELAFVEVSSDGINYFRFPSISEAHESPQYWNGSYSDCRFFNNLAGKYRANYGTPFDLEELSGEVGLDVNAITHVKLIDVVGFVDPTYGTQDSQGNYINDPYPTAFPSGGFDLDAVAVIHEGTQSISENAISSLSVYPNPSNGLFHVKTSETGSFSIIDATGSLVLSSSFSNDFSIDLTSFQKGIYILQVNNGSGIYVERLNKM